MPNGVHEQYDFNAIMDILTKMRVEIAGIRQEIQNVKEDLNGIKEDIRDMNDRINKLSERIARTEANVNNIRSQQKESLSTYKQLVIAFISFFLGIITNLLLSLIRAS